MIKYIPRSAVVEMAAVDRVALAAAADADAAALVSKKVKKCHIE